MKIFSKAIMLIASSSLLGAMSYADGGNDTLKSEFTSIKVKDCIVVSSSENEINPEIDHHKHFCPGVGGYSIIDSGGDLRYSISLYLPESQFEVQLTELGSFHGPNSDVVEWLYQFVEGRATYKFMIHRLWRQVGNEDGVFRDVDTLFVTRLDGPDSCVVAKVDQSRHMNQRARDLAAAANKDPAQFPCLSKESL